MFHVLLRVALVVVGGMAVASAVAPSTPWTPKVLEQLRRAAALMGIAVPPLMVTSRVPNAASDGRQILVNPTWLSRTMARFCSMPACQDAVILGVMAHELGHHVFGHAADSRRDSHVAELDADRVAGVVLARAGVSTGDFERVLADLGECGTTSHPGAALRVAAIRAGYLDERGWS
jgi:hypothetical protein